MHATIGGGECGRRHGASSCGGSWCWETVIPCRLPRPPRLAWILSAFREFRGVESLIARIRERVADPLRAVDAATWVEPMPTIAPPATAAEVDAAEAALGFAIPPLLRRLYVEVAGSARATG